MKVIFHPEAEFELCTAREWYARQRRGLDAEFMCCVDEAVAGIKEILKCFRSHCEMRERRWGEDFPTQFTMR